MATSKGRCKVIYSKRFNDFKIVPIKQVYKKKYIAWYSIEKYNYVMESVDGLKSQIQLYKLKDDIHFLPYLPVRNRYLDNSIRAFDYYSSEQGYELPYFKNVLSTLRDIIVKDVPFKLNGEIYLYHSYMILGFIRNSYLAYELSKNKEFTDNTIAKFDRSKQSFRLEYKKHKKLYLKHKQSKKLSKEKVKTSYFLTAFIYRTLYYRDKYLKFFLACFSMIGINNISMLGDLEDYELEKIQEAFTLFMSGKVSKQDCTDSLTIILYYYLLFKMRFNKNEALIYTKYLVGSVYEDVNSYTGSELLRNIHIKEVLGSHIVFNCSVKTQITTESQKDYLEIFLISSLKESSIDCQRFAIEQIRPLLDNPIKIYIQTTPIELLEKY